MFTSCDHKMPNVIFFPLSEGDLYKLLESADLLSYYEAFVSHGGDNIKQLLRANEEDFEEIIDLVGMSSKRLHVRRLEAALDEWEQGERVTIALYTTLS